MKLYYLHRPTGYLKKQVGKIQTGIFSFSPLYVALGLLLVVIAYYGARHNKNWSEPLFWLGLTIQFVVVLIKVLQKNTKRTECLILLIDLGISLYLVKYLHSPFSFTFHDEFAHWKTANDILATAHLFNPNTLISISPLYPGLEIVTQALSHLSGLSIYASGIILLGIARIILVLSLFLVYDQISKSFQIASLATLIYMGTNHFVFWLSQYSYESLALPLVLFTVYLLVSRVTIKGRVFLFLSLMTFLSICAVVITHHLASYILIAFLGLWASSISITILWVRLCIVKIKSSNTLNFTGRLTIYQKMREKLLSQAKNINATLFIALVSCLTWLLYVAPKTLTYLSPLFFNAVSSLFSMITGELNSRELFTSPTGYENPIWERVILSCCTFVILFWLFFGLLTIWKNWDKIVAIVLTTISILYPMSLLGRLVYSSTEISSRISDFIFIVLALVIAVSLGKINSFHSLDKIRFLIIVVSVLVIFLGGVIIGWPAWARLPGSYLVVSDTRSIEQKGISAAQWVLTHLGPNQSMATDRINTVLMGSYGHQNMVREVSDGRFVAEIFFAEELGPKEIKIIKDGRIKYLLVDRRLSIGLPGNGVYFDVGEPDTNQHKSPIDLTALMKFQNYPLVNRIFDSGDIVIYDVGVFLDVP